MAWRKKEIRTCKPDLKHFLVPREWQFTDVSKCTAVLVSMNPPCTQLRKAIVKNTYCLYIRSPDPMTPERRALLKKNVSALIILLFKSNKFCTQVRALLEVLEAVVIFFGIDIFVIEL